MRTWERGSGVTLACGTGASAVCVAGALTGRTGRKLLAHLPGGDLDLEFAADNHVFMTGPATEVFTGEWPTTLIREIARPGCAQRRRVQSGPRMTSGGGVMRTNGEAASPCCESVWDFMTITC